LEERGKMTVMAVTRSFACEFSSYSPTKKILLTLAAVGVFCVAATSPFFLHNVIRIYFSYLSQKETRNHTRVLYKLKKEKSVVFKKDAQGNILVTLTRKGKKKVLAYNIERMKLKQMETWDNQWRIMMYDISKLRKHRADILRRKIKKLGLYRLQKSVWTYPYPFEEEMQFLFTVYKIPLEEFLYFITPHIAHENKIKKVFNL
jgi:DNA-binding transcriptional regulator PaaX